MQLKREEPIKSRSHAATIKAAYTTLTGNFWQIVRHVWPYVLGVSVVSAAFTVYAHKLLAGPPSGAFLLLFPALLLLLFAVSCLVGSRCFMMVNGQSFGWNLVRALKLTLWYLLPIVLVSIVSGGITGWYIAMKQQAQAALPSTPETSLNHIGVVVQGTLLCGAIFLAAALLLLPFLYTMAKYIADSSTRMHRMLWQTYRVGLRHWGYLFLVSLLYGIAATLFMTVIGSPLAVLNAALQTSAAGTLSGDPSGLPGYMEVMLYVTAFITHCLSYICSIFGLFVLYYLYGSIEAKEAERHQSRNTQLADAEAGNGAAPTQPITT